MLKQQRAALAGRLKNQPPSGGCVLKHDVGNTTNLSIQSAAFGRLCVETKHPAKFRAIFGCQPPSGGCVLKQLVCCNPVFQACQPPSGGCVLKRIARAARQLADAQPPSGGCVLKRRPVPACQAPLLQPPSGGCVLKRAAFGAHSRPPAVSRLRAAVC